METKKYLGKFSWLFMLVMGLCVSFSLSSCGDDDDDDVVNNGSGEKSSIIGVWDYYHSVGEDPYGKYDDYFSKETGGAEIEFRSNGTLLQTEYENNMKIATYRFSYVVEGNSLIVSGEEDGEKFTDKYTILTCNDKELVIELYEKFSDNDWEHTIDTFKRVK